MEQKGLFTKDFETCTFTEAVTTKNSKKRKMSIYKPKVKHVEALFSWGATPLSPLFCQNSPISSNGNLWSKFCFFTETVKAQ